MFTLAKLHEKDSLTDFHPKTQAQTSGEKSASEGKDWWRSAVIYQVYPRSFASDQGGLGTINGITAKLNYLKNLGVNAIWISPFYPSPQRDAGYDVANYCDVDPRLGTLADFDKLITKAHQLGLKILIDLVPNHTSDEHQAFQTALAAGPGSPARDRYHFRPGKPGDGAGSTVPPNNWGSVFGGPAWTQVCARADAPGNPWEHDQQYYLHLFDSSQPDVNWENPHVKAEFTKTLRFWLDRGVHGFRVDVAHALVKAPGLPDCEEPNTGAVGQDKNPPMFDQPAVHDIYRHWRKVLDEYPGKRILVAEAWVEDLQRLAKYVRADEMNQAFNFKFLTCPWHPAALRQVITESYQANDQVGAATTWVLCNHDVVRHASRLGYPLTDGVPSLGCNPKGIAAYDPQPNLALGLARARAATALMLALPGSAYLYQGEELGLPEHTQLPDDLRQDPSFFRTLGRERGRDGCRVPLPWVANAPGFGFSPSGETWLPQPSHWAALAADQQVGQPGSTFEFYREALRWRRELGLGTAGAWVVEDLTSADSLAMWVGGSAPGEAADVAGGGLLVLVSFAKPVKVPPGWSVVLSSAGAMDKTPDESGVAGHLELPPDTTVWLRKS